MKYENPYSDQSPLGNIPPTVEHKAETISPMERQRRLIDASHQYMGGELSSEDYRETFKRYAANFTAAFLAQIQNDAVQPHEVQ